MGNRLRVGSVPLLAASLAVACGDDGGDDGRPGGGVTAPGDGGGDDGGDGDGDGGGGDGGGGDDGGGDGGDGGDDGGSIPFCVEECSADEDCWIGGEPSQFACDGGRCLGDTSDSQCTEDADCTPVFSGWIYTCQSSADCTSQECIDIGESEGRCATIPTEYVACVDIMMVEADYPLFDGSGTVTVCARLDVACNEDNYCYDPCESDADCTYYPGQPVCDTGTGRCTCTQDAHCADAMGASVCMDGWCRCGADADCLDMPNADTCYDGFCGCSDASVCTGEQSFDGTTFVCEPY